MFVMAAITKYPRQSGLTEMYFLTVMESLKSEIKGVGMIGFFQDASQLVNDCLPVFLHGLDLVSLRLHMVCVLISYKDAVILD